MRSGSMSSCAVEVLLCSPRVWQRIAFPASLAIAALLTTACGTTGISGSAFSGAGSNSLTAPSTTTVNNIQSIQAGTGPNGTGVNMLLTSVTVCVPGTSSCQTIPNILVDTGSVGLRLFASVVTLSLPRLTDASGNPVGNCVAFANTTYAWGPVATADIRIAGEFASSVPMQLVGVSGFPAAPSACDTGTTSLDTATLDANGILGVGVFQQDCGSACVTSGAQLPSIYFGCPSSGCVTEAVSLQQQVQNPVTRFPQDNNGFAIYLPALDTTGNQTVPGSLIFGIGTQSNNVLSSVQIYTADTNGNIAAMFSGTTYTNSFVDSGSEAVFFLNSSTLGVPLCASNAAFYCPSSPISYSAIITGSNGAANTAAFGVANAEALFGTGKVAFNNLGGPTASGFDFGLPFFFGRYVFVAIQGENTSSGVGPFWAF